MYWWNELMCGQMKMSQPLTKFSTYFHVVLAIAESLAESLAVFQRSIAAATLLLPRTWLPICWKALDIHIM